MKKRIRKKKRLGEFREWGCEIEITLRSPSDLDIFLDLFVQQIEEMGCYCGGGGAGVRLSMMAELGRGEQNSLILKERLLGWVKACHMVQDSSASPIFDLWHGEPPSINGST